MAAGCNSQTSSALSAWHQMTAIHVSFVQCADNTLKNVLALTTDDVEQDRATMRQFPTVPGPKVLEPIEIHQRSVRSWLRGRGSQRMQRHRYSRCLLLCGQWLLVQSSPTESGSQQMRHRHYPSGGHVCRIRIAAADDVRFPDRLQQRARDA